MNFIESMRWRGMLHDHTPGLSDHLSRGMVTAYIGFDPTAPSLTIGNYVQIMLLKFFQLDGHRPIVLMGGATGRIGDPSGKDKERELKSEEELDRNLAFQKEQFKKFLNFKTGPNNALFENNYNFYKNLNTLDFLRNVGKHLTVNYMMSKDSVQNRLESGLSFTEFSYQLLQAYDYYCLYQTYACSLQMGGSDQWGNITTGTEYLRRTVVGAEAHALTSPLLTKADGKKFGKSEEGNIWLDPNMTSPYKFYQFWLNADDQDLSKFLRIFSLKSIEEIQILENKIITEPNLVKKELAQELCSRIHSTEAYLSAMQVSELLFNSRVNTEFIQSLELTQWDIIADEIPVFEIQRDEINKKENIIDFLHGLTTITPSKSEARKAIQNLAISINKQKISSIDYSVTPNDLIHNRFLLIENGKKNKYLIRVIG